MLFVLRLLPSYKKWQQKIVYVLFFLNFAITAVACVTYGVSCIPFKAVYDTSVQGAQCFSKDRLVIVTQINGALAAVIDVCTAMIPQFLIWNVKMHPKTKLTLNIIFGLGLATSAMCIGRAATITKAAMETDSTYLLMTSKWFGMIEEKFGNIFACAPAIRQFWAYRKRVGTTLPTNKRQNPDEDFVKMRRRVNLRDIFWYRSADLSSDGTRVFDAKPAFKRAIEPPPSQTSQDIEAQVWTDQVLSTIYR
jgi:hypothetical protein